MRNGLRRIVPILLGGMMAAAGCDSCKPQPVAPAPEAAETGDGPAIVTIASGKDSIWLEEIKYAISKYGSDMKSRFTAHSQQDSLVQRLTASRLLVLEAQSVGLDRNPEFQSQSLAFKEGQLSNLFLSDLQRQWEAGYEEPEEKDLYEYYLTHSERYKKGEQVRISMILVRHSEEMAAEDKARAKKKIEEARARLRLGEDFAKVAEKYSEDSSSINGGDIGFIGRDFNYRVSHAAFNQLKYIGDVSDIIEDARFLRIIMLTDKREEAAIPFETVIDEVRELRKKELESSYREARIQEVVASIKVAEYPERLKFNVDSCNGDTTVLAEFNGAQPLTVDEYCGALLDRASFNPALLEPGSHRVGLLRDLIQRRCLAAEGAKGAAGKSREFRYEVRRMEERILYQIFNRYYVDNIYRFEANEGTLRAFYNANLPKFTDPATQAPIPFESVMDRVRDEFIRVDKQNQYGIFIESLWDKHGAVFNRPLLDKYREELAAIAHEPSAPDPVVDPPVRP